MLCYLQRRESQTTSLLYDIETSRSELRFRLSMQRICYVSYLCYMIKIFTLYSGVFILGFVYVLYRLLYRPCRMQLLRSRRTLRSPIRLCFICYLSQLLSYL